MSIYQVPIKEWFCDETSPFHDCLSIVKIAIESGERCKNCNKPITLKRGYCSHAIAYGFGEMYCCAKCAGNQKRKGDTKMDDIHENARYKNLELETGRCTACGDSYNPDKNSFNHLELCDGCGDDLQRETNELEEKYGIKIEVKK